MEIVLYKSLSSSIVEEIKQLERDVKAFDGVSLKLELDYKLQYLQDESHINEILCYEANHLVGYLGILSFGSAAEISGMVHPNYRRQGIYKRLLSEAMGVLRQRKISQVLLLADEKSKSGRICIEHLGGSYRNSEFEMTYTPTALELLGLIQLTPAASTEVDVIGEIDAACFEESHESISENTYIARVDNQIVGKSRLEVVEGEGGIFGLGILPRYQGNGYGKALLEASIHRLEQLGSKRIYLQVVTDNQNALNLYRKTGFVVDYQMNYFELKDSKLLITG